MELTDLKGIGPKTAALLNKVGVTTPEELVRYYPVGYDEYTPPEAVSALAEGAKGAVLGVISGSVTLRRYRKVQIVTTEVSDPTGKIRLTWYNAPFMTGVLRRGARLVFRGLVRTVKGVRIMEHPEVFTPEKYAELERTLVPVYGLTKGLSGKTIARAVRQALGREAGLVNEYLPETLIRLLGLQDEQEAVRSIHFPHDREEFLRARQRLVFDEFFLSVITLRRLKSEEKDGSRPLPVPPVWITEEVIDALPYPLTGAQKRVWREIETDLAADGLMNRLVQGDVGSGKTILAFLAMLQTAANGMQAALMAPTEVLARQHFEKLCGLLDRMKLDGFHPVLLTGSMGVSDRRQALKAIEEGTAKLIVGTHALIEDRVLYNRLALVITDEQHRFGVRQRKSFAEKGDMPNALVMSATPIPRTLGVIFYGDLDISVLDERPARRLPIRSAVVDSGWRPNALRFIRREAEAGRQAYVICPMIEKTEELELASVTVEAAALTKEFGGLKVGMLHGRMKPEEKNRVMESFASGEIRILVSTTVVEVGVDVPNATVMLIENAERFGLAQLHQLRGRVGRGVHQSYCIFMAGQTSEAVMKRLSIMKESDDGFEIAEKDFELRGPGDLLGIRQSGDAMFRLADVSRDREMLKMAGETAGGILSEDPALLAEDHQSLREELNRYMSANERNITL